MFLNLERINKNKIAAWAVHGFTGSGAVLGFLAIIAILPAIAHLLGISKPFSRFYGGTSLIIIVNVILETL